MPAPAPVRPRERLMALAAVVLVQGALIVGLMSGFHVDVSHTRDFGRAADRHHARPAATAAARSPVAAEGRATGAPCRSGAESRARTLGRLTRAAPGAGASGSSARRRSALQPHRPPAAGAGPVRRSGSGAGGGSGGNGAWLGRRAAAPNRVQIAGEILPSDYPRELGKCRHRRPCRHSTSRSS